MIRVGFSRAKGFWGGLSRVIMAFTGRTYSHCWLLIDDAFMGKTMVLQSSKEGFGLVPFEGFEVCNQIVKVVDPPFPLDTGVSAAVSWLGETYDVEGLFGMMGVILGRRFKKKWKNIFAGHHKMFCSEAVVAVLQASGNYPNTKDVDPSRMGPEDVDDLLAGKTVD